ncbi:MAG: hypothetical protein AAF226_04580 [Verrucomicrobiota bacterium]
MLGVFWIASFGYLFWDKKSPLEVLVVIFIIPFLIYFLGAFQWMTFAADAYRQVVFSDYKPYKQTVFLTSSDILRANGWMAIICGGMLTSGVLLTMFLFRKKRLSLLIDRTTMHPNE